MIGASAALHTSDLVWDGPMAGIRIGRIDGKFIPYPTFAEREQSDIDMIVAATKDAIVMVEGEMSEMAESEVIDAMLFGHENIKPVLELQEKIRKACGKPKREFVEPKLDESLVAKVHDLTAAKIKKGLSIREKHSRSEALSNTKSWLMEEIAAEGKPYAGQEKDVDAAYACLLYTSPSPRDATLSRMPSSA